MAPTPLTPAALAAALALRDLTDDKAGSHALQLVLAAIEDALHRAWHMPVCRHRLDPVVAIADNYDRLGYPPDAVTRDARYTRHVDAHHVLRSQTSAMIPPLLRGLAAGPVDDVILSCPGLVYRRDAIDRLHVGEPHQVDLWRIRAAGPRLSEDDLQAMIGLVVTAALPGRRWRTVPAIHPYTVQGRQIDVADADDWVEIGECGLAADAVVGGAGLDPRRTSGLAMGLGLDRLLLLRKGIDDIRLLRSGDPRVAGQMGDLTPYRPVSTMPPITRDLSLAVAGDTSAEALGDRLRCALGPDAAAVESAEVLSETPSDELPAPARARLGLQPGQRNVLLRVVLRDLDRTLTADEANHLRDHIYAALHEGTVATWATAGVPFHPRGYRGGHGDEHQG